MPDQRAEIYYLAGQLDEIGAEFARRLEEIMDVDVLCEIGDHLSGSLYLTARVFWRAEQIDQTNLRAALGAATQGLFSI